MLDKNKLFYVELDFMDNILGIKTSLTRHHIFTPNRTFWTGALVLSSPDDRSHATCHRGRTTAAPPTQFNVRTFRKQRRPYTWPQNTIRPSLFATFPTVTNMFASAKNAESLRASVGKKNIQMTLINTGDRPSDKKISYMRQRQMKNLNMR